MARGYVYDQGFAEERKHLRGIESLWDPGTQALLDELGIGPGWRCLEVGAGGGSLLHWMTGRGATVVAIDIDTRFIDRLASETIEVRRVDIRTDELPRGEFDLVHARQVLEHLTERRQILHRLAATLRPGGWLVIEDFDWTDSGSDAADPRLARVGEGRVRVIDSASPGFDFFRLSFESLRATLIEAGLISSDDADAAAARYSEGSRIQTPIMMAGIGRRR